jgi:hypothetical protein
MLGAVELQRQLRDHVINGCFRVGDWIYPLRQWRVVVKVDRQPGMLGLDDGPDLVPVSAIQKALDTMRPAFEPRVEIAVNDGLLVLILPAKPIKECAQLSEGVERMCSDVEGLGLVIVLAMEPLAISDPSLRE